MCIRDRCWVCLGVGELTFKLNPGKPFGLWIPFWVSLPTYVMPKEVVEPLAISDIMTDYNGSGPFKYVEWIPGNRVVMDKNENYNPRSDEPNGDAGARIAYVDRVINLEVPDAATKLAALQTKQTDFAEDCQTHPCLLYTSPSPRDRTRSRMPSSA